VRTIETLNFDFFVQRRFAFLDSPRSRPFMRFDPLSVLQSPRFVFAESFNADRAPARPNVPPGRILRESEQLLRSVMDILPVGIFIMDAQGTIVSANRMRSCALDD